MTPTRLAAAPRSALLLAAAALAVVPAAVQAQSSHRLPPAPTVTMTVDELVAMQQRAPTPRGPTVSLPLSGTPQIVPPKPAPLPVEVATYGAAPRPLSPEAAAIAASASAGVAQGSVSVIEAIGEVGFSSQSATLDPDAQAQLAALASQLRQRLGAQPSARVRIAPRYQMGLEKDVMVERRGQALVGALVAAGVPASRIQVETDITGRRDAGGRRSRVELLLIR